MSDELLLMGLRLTDGMILVAALCGRPLDDASRPPPVMADQDQDGTVRVTRAGFPVLNAVIAQLAA